MVNTLKGLEELTVPSVVVRLERGGREFPLSVRPLMSTHLEDIRKRYPDPKAPRVTTHGPTGNEIVRPDFQDEEYVEKVGLNNRKQSRAITVMALGMPFFGTEDFDEAVEKVNKHFSLTEIVQINRAASQMNEMTPDMVEDEKETMLPFDTTRVEAGTA